MRLGTLSLPEDSAQSVCDVGCSIQAATPSSSNRNASSSSAKHVFSGRPRTFSTVFKRFSTVRRATPNALAADATLRPAKLHNEIPLGYEKRDGQMTPWALSNSLTREHMAVANGLAESRVDEIIRERVTSLRALAKSTHCWTATPG
jgi:hypothetical protein